jgi:hypothetical protein
VRLLLRLADLISATGLPWRMVCTFRPATALRVPHLELLMSFRRLVSCSPQPLRRVQRIDIEVLPPTEFVTALVKLAMMKPAEWDSEFTHLAPECPLFSEPKVMGIRRGATAGQTGLGGHEP